VVLAALLFGFLRGGATRMQSMAGIPIDIISIIQGLVIIFIAAPGIIRWLYRLKEIKVEDTVLTRGWGS
jgi:simple sugar transport system permease protein